MFEFEEPYQRDLALVGLGVLVVVLCVGGALAYLTLTSQSAKYLSVEETDTIYPHEEVVAFESMTPAQQRAFEAALADEDNRAEVTGVSTEVWTDHRAVSYRGELYEVGVLSVN
ncbi:hypothetical protein C2R22_05075 [Salinigranum rubrum]|uniref:DUF7979 domain-containing protein n=1 Tax=Salinigranum rubrum TaxID=755307 RepID=A0A2I8VGS2_9EURY|nr:hypothetical protein [Salinigranum rubrum]AUV81110.1 hypothetical protein C2R22_05075 [Salinigranum rubrum]